MGGNHEKSIYNQLMDAMGRLDAMESECRKSHMEIKSLNAGVKSLGQLQFFRAAVRGPARKDSKCL